MCGSSLSSFGTYPPPPPFNPPIFPELRRAALDLYLVRPPVLRKLPDLGIATRVNISPLSPLRNPVFDEAIAAATTAGAIPFPINDCNFLDASPGIVVGIGGALLVLCDFRFLSSVEVSTASLITLLLELRELFETRFFRLDREATDAPTVLPDVLRNELFRPPDTNCDRE
ncbi:hypothetical protein FF38_10327 [Lucilia cuprina]|uniref:Uncharacterized protein n=1 Tax=Lucilia cuprina TaxID=7375 RepID=A0A0L0C0U2_LUCCU|nr:hypothetical protein FF38_10327 [Lucilia cuprina]